MVPGRERAVPVFQSGSEHVKLLLEQQRRQQCSTAGQASPIARVSVPRAASVAGLPGVPCSRRSGYSCILTVKVAHLNGLHFPQVHARDVPRLMTSILGISAFYHDSAAALLQDGEIVAAVQEERFSRQKYDARFPEQSISWCLSERGLDASDLDYVAYYEQPLSKFERLIETYVAYAPQGFNSFRQALPVWLKRKLHVARAIREGLEGRFEGRILYPSHHESHAASAFFPSPFQEAAIVTLDGVGEWSTTTVGFGQGNRVELLEETRFPHSLGLLYSAFTGYCGFSVNSGEYKLMGLAPYGKPRYEDLIFEHLIALRADGSYWLSPRYFRYAYDLKMISDRFEALFGGPPRRPDSRIEQRHMDLAASIQRVCEQVVLHTARHAWESTGRPSALVMAGGVALNCVANGRLLREGPFEQIWIQPAAGDAGGALGAALFAWHQLLGHERSPARSDSQRASWLGPAYSPVEIKQLLDGLNVDYEQIEDEPALLREVASALADGLIVGWFQGRAEFGPRALGARSILGDPRRAEMQADLNLKIKFRESFRPFAPCVLREHAHEWFDVRPGEDSPYMLMVAPVSEIRRLPLSEEQRATLGTDPDLSRRVNIARSSVPAVTHVDFSARIQTVDDRHGRFQRLLQAFNGITGCPILVNTSFNLSWEPIVLTPQEAYNTFMQSEMDVLVLENCVLRKDRQRLGFVTGLGETGEAETQSVPWGCPGTGAPLVVEGGELTDPSTGACFPVREGIPRIGNLPAMPAGAPSAEEAGQAFGNVRELLERFRRVPLYRLLADQVPFSWRVLEYGCGSGWLTLFLAIARRAVLGVDDDIEALRQAMRFRDRQGIKHASFAQTDLLEPGLQPGFFDLVILRSDLASPGRSCRELLSSATHLVRPGRFLLVVADDSPDLRAAAKGELPAYSGRLEPWSREMSGSGLEFPCRFPPPWPDELDAASQDLFSVSRAEPPFLSSWLGELLRPLHYRAEGEAQAIIARRPGREASSP